MQERYLLQFGDGPQREVSKAEWVAAERAAGFTGGPPGEPSTGGFGNGGVRGSIAYGPPEAPVERRTWPRLTDPPEMIRKVRQTGGNRTVWTRMEPGGPYWATRGWEQGVDWAQVLRWGEVEDVTDEPEAGVDGE